MHLLLLPDELFLMEIFPYLHSADLIRAFGTLGNIRLLSLTYASIRHLDLPDEINYVETLRHYHWNQIRSLSIHEDHLHESICSIFPSLNHVQVRMASSPAQSIGSCLLSLSPRVTHLRLLFDECEEVPVANRLAEHIWHRDNRTQRLSIVNGLLVDETYFLEICSSLVRNEHLTHLSLVVAGLRSSIPFLALSPAVEHLRIRVVRQASTWSNRTEYFLERYQWSSRVKSFHLTAHETYLDNSCLCAYIKRFAASLERLTFYAQTIQSYLMRSQRGIEEHLLSHLPKLQHLDFCVHAGMGREEDKNRRSFDGWKHQRHVISVFEPMPGFHTRFTMPFVFDRLDRVTNEFVDFHSNQARPDLVLTLPSITSISFYLAASLNLKLMSTLKHVCPRLRQLIFNSGFKFHDDVIADTQLTLPTVERVRLCTSRGYEYRSHQRLLSLIPNLVHLTINADQLRDMLDAVDVRYQRFDAIRHLILIDTEDCSFAERRFLAQYFRNANLIYRNSFC